MYIGLHRKTTTFVVITYKHATYDLHLSGDIHNEMHDKLCAIKPHQCSHGKQARGIQGSSNLVGNRDMEPRLNIIQNPTTSGDYCLQHTLWGWGGGWGRGNDHESYVTLLVCCQNIETISRTVVMRQLRM